MKNQRSLGVLGGHRRRPDQPDRIADRSQNVGAIDDAREAAVTIDDDRHLACLGHQAPRGVGDGQVGHGGQGLASALT